MSRATRDMLSVGIDVGPLLAESIRLHSVIRSYEIR